MARLKTFDSKYAPKNQQSPTAAAGLVDSPRNETLALLEQRCERRSPEFYQHAYDFLEDWRINQPDGYYGRTPRELVLAAIIATAIHLD